MRISHDTTPSRLAGIVETETGHCFSSASLAFSQKTGTACHAPFRHGMKERIGTMFTCSFPWEYKCTSFLSFIANVAHFLRLSGSCTIAKSSKEIIGAHTVGV
jgi:hypothetical protein